MSTSTERARLARERKRNGVAPHACPCGHEHYPCNAVASTGDQCNAVALPPSATALQARLDAMVERLTDMQAKGREYQRLYEADHATLAALLTEHGKVCDALSRVAPAEYRRLVPE